MEARSTSSHIWLGGAIRYLVSVDEGWSIFREDHVLPNIRDIAKRLDDEFPVSRRLFREIEVLASGWEREAKAWQEENPEGDVEEWKRTRFIEADEAKTLHRLARNLESTVWAESEVQVAFITREKRYDVNRLLNDVGSLMSDGVYDALPTIAQGDFAAAGRCIAFELPTAAAFHLMRGTEGVLRDFYCRMVRRERVRPQLWGPMTDHLRRRRDMPPEVLMNNLDNIRRAFRNPTQHPDKVYDIDEAQDLLALSIDVVSRMQRHLQAVDR